MYCPNCGTKNDDEGNFCSSCGRSLNLDQTQIPDDSDTQTYVHTNEKKEGTVYKVLGWIFFGISILFIPILFAAGSFIMGYLLRKGNVHNETHGTILMVMAIAGGVIGSLLGMAAAGY